MSRNGRSVPKPLSVPAELRRRGTVWDNLKRETTFMNDLREFSSDTSAHGIKYIFESPKKIMKIVFMLLWLALSAYAVYTICTKIIMFANKPSGTKFEVVVDANEEQKNRGIKFPTITVCSMNKARKSYLDADENKMIKEYFEIVDKYNTTLLADLTNRMNDPEDEMFNIKDLTYESLLENGGPLPNRFLKCEQRSTLCHSLKAFNETGVPIISSMENSISGRCWRVNPNGRLRGKMGDYGALKIGFWADVQDYSTRAADKEIHGFVVAFHDSETYGATMFSGFLMSPGTYYKADLSLKKIARNKAKAESCNASLVQTTYGLYNEGACVLECKDQSLNHKCGCVNILPPENNGTYKPCTLEEWARCGLAHYREWYQNYTDTMRKDAFCPCDTACDETKYESDISSSSISIDFANLIHPNVGGMLKGFSNPEFNISYTTPEDILKNFMVLEILFTSMQEYQVNEIITYDLGNLFGDVGGVLGLFLGASLFTIIEFLLFFVVSIAKYCCKATASGWLDIT